MNKKYLLYLFIAFQALIVLGMIGKSIYPLWVGTPVKLLIEARDPRDIFRGDYVVLSYDFNSLDLDSIDNQLDTSYDYHKGDVVYLGLEKRGEYYYTRSIHDTEPKSGLFLKGTVNYFRSYSSQIDVNCGIASFFTDSEKAKLLEQELRQQDIEENPLSATVMLTSGGLARIKQINYPEINNLTTGE